MNRRFRFDASWLCYRPATPFRCPSLVDKLGYYSFIYASNSPFYKMTHQLSKSLLLVALAWGSSSAFSSEYQYHKFIPQLKPSSATAPGPLTPPPGGASSAPDSGLPAPVLTPVLDVSTESLSWSTSHLPTAVGGKTSQSVSVLNTGNGKLTFSGAPSLTSSTATSFTSETSCGENLLPAASCEVTVYYSPVSNNTVTGALVIDAGNSKKTVTLTASPYIAPALEASSVSFGAVGLDTTKTAVITARNTGTAPLTGVNLASASVGTGVSVVSSTCGTQSSPVTLNAGENCTVTLSWTPVDAGESTSNLTLTSIANSVPVIVSGTATPTTGVTALLRLDSLPIIDDKGNTVGQTGQAAQIVQGSAVGAGAAYWPATGGLTLPLDVSDFGSNDFTVEAWVKPASFPGGIFSRDNNANVNYGNALFMLGANGQVYAHCNPNAGSASGRVTIQTPLSTIPLNTWSHVAWTRKNNVMKLFVNGNQISTASGACTFRSTDVTRIGYEQKYSSPVSYFNGMLDHVRFVKGRSLYNSNFKPARDGN